MTTSPRTKVKRYLAHQKKSYADYHRREISDEEISELVDVVADEPGTGPLLRRSRRALDNVLAVANRDRRPETRGTPPGLYREGDERGQRAGGLAPARNSAADLKGLADMREVLGKRVFAQDPILDTVVDAVHARKAGITDTKRPIFAGLFLGPSRVGKSETGEALADYLGYNADEVIVLNGGEFSEPHSIARLIGPPPGYTGYTDHAPLLTEPVRLQPKRLILIEEIDQM